MKIKDWFDAMVAFVFLVICLGICSALVGAVIGFSIAIAKLTFHLWD
tara:strand:+ start:441 stop:581 length:141 start_codon:yes stop_codon:yes gene_type:complete